MAGLAATSPAEAVRRDALIGWWWSAATVALLLAWTVADASAARYALYALPLLLVLIQAVIGDLRLDFDRRGVAALLLYLGLLAIAARHGVPGSHGIRDAIIVASYLVVFALHGRVPERAVDALAAALLGCMLVEMARNGVTLSIDLLGSTGISESNFAFPVGAVLLFYLHRRRWLAALLLAVLLFVAYKRIAFLAVLLPLAFERAVAAAGWEGRARALAIGTVVLLSLLSLYSSQLFEFVALELGGEDVSANSVSLGRFEFAEVLHGLIGQAGFGATWLGHGPGTADAAVAATIPDASNPHNDWLKILFEYGWVGFAAFHVLLATLYGGGPLARALYLYAAVVMMTDNTLIYSYHQAVVFLVLRAACDGPGAPARSRPRHRRRAALLATV